MNTIPKTAGQWATVLKGLGFRRRGAGQKFRHNGLALTPQGRWLTATTKIDRDENPLWDQLGRPGLWKQVNGDGRPRREFDLPLRMMEMADDPADDPADEEDEQGGGLDAFEACAAWMSATALDDLPAGWICPDREEVESWIPAAGLTLQQKSLVRQGSLICGPERLALRMPIVAELPEDLSPTRREWLEEVLLDAQNRWRMVRIGMEGQTERPSVIAEVDLSGAPRIVLEALFSTALSSLRWVVSWVVKSADLLADVQVDCRVLEVGHRG